MTSTRNSFYDIVKALGIIAIVFGHTGVNFYSKFFYTFHIAIFLFVTGLLFKHKDSIAEQLYKKVRQSWVPYVIYSLVFLIGNPILLGIGIQESTPYTFETFFPRVIDILLLSKTERLTGPMWFVPFFIISSIVFILLENLCSKASSQAKKNLLLFMLTSIGGAFGMVLVLLNYNPNFRASISLLFLPIMFLGFFITQLKINFTKLLRLPIFLLSIAIIAFVLIKTGLRVELSQNDILHPALFYPITILGIYSCCYLAKLISLIPKVKTTFAEIGKYTFDIMALHLFFIKLADLVYISLFSKEFDILSKYPRSYGNKWQMMIVYVIVGILGPIFTRKVFDFIMALARKTLAKASHKEKTLPPIPQEANPAEA